MKFKKLILLVLNGRYAPSASFGKIRGHKK